MIDQVIQVIILAAIALVTIGVETLMAKNSKVKAVIDVINELAPSAVVAAEKTGIAQGLTGQLKKSEAVQTVITELQKLGWTDADTKTVENAVEKAWAELAKDGTLSTYSDKKEEVQSEATTANQK
ncbi:MAG: phage holin [Lactobacillus delbrueckii]|jgi:LL-H family phage holin|uniref:phage holin n=1 Tax=Lactobacillus delbrueckii TaxID=1584 RepID=UPI000230EED3|nr:phage holin [Lactobacillus delbrueckii]MEE0122718.1 phage holin [Streptococcus salivarius]DAL95036.1 MAG TPA: holin [Caudoviricetes sp.]EHE89066.1 hypothetical protein LDBUL1519_01033 [Lactobacillus delbrueckii subsp. bulgaricus CNCM I-1519]MCD5449052.1 phage holin [Lactobacillus delbrueckii subsp. bulgaricus]MCH5408831.1 phage holin [Lactobacillus delbrueckii]